MIFYHSYFLRFGDIMKLRKKKNKLIPILVIAALVLSVFAGIFITEINSRQVSTELSVSECQTIVNNTFSDLAKSTAIGSKKVLSNTKITVKSAEIGDEKNIILQCDYSTLDVGSVITERKTDLLSAVCKKYFENEKSGISTNATRISIDIASQLNIYLEEAKPVSGSITLELYEVEENKFTLFLEDSVVDKCTGGLITVVDEINGVNSVTVDGEIVDITKKNTLKTGVKQCLALKNYDNKKPDVGGPFSKWWNDFADEFSRNFIAKAQWKYLSDGLLMTLSISGLSALIGTFIGFFVAIIRCTYQTTGKLKTLDRVFSLYLTVMRGTPVMVQLLIIYFVFLLPAGVDKFPAAVLCFGLNSGAYVAEIVRGGIMSVDRGQIEAGRSLGFNYASTMIHVVVPQAFKAILPALANEFITLLKESSVAFYIGVADLTQGGLKIRSITYSNFMPLIAVALIYLVIVIILTKLVGLLERRLRKSDH